MMSLHEHDNSTKCTDDFISKILEKKLWAPANELMIRPKKEIRSKLVLLGYELAKSFQNLPELTQDFSNLTSLMKIIEEIHTGSLIVDDIQDNSSLRRGAPTVHIMHGTAIALNAGNWLYFKALQQIEEIPLSLNQKIYLYQIFNRTLCKAHQGQAIDLGTDILKCPADHVEQVCMNSLELKSGSLVGLAMSIGSVIAGSDEKSQQKIYDIGKEFGVLLQMFDDLGNLNTSSSHPKNLEDLYLKRPSFVWAFLFAHCSDSERALFISAVEKLPDRTALNSLLEKSQIKLRMISHAQQKMQIFKEDLLKTCGSQSTPKAVKKIFQIGDQLYGAYN